jgi:hypothetical protein
VRKYISAEEFGSSLLALREVALSGGCVGLSYEERVDVAPRELPLWIEAMDEWWRAQRILARTLKELRLRHGDGERDFTIWWRVVVKGQSQRRVARQMHLSQQRVSAVVTTVNVHIENFLFYAHRYDVHGARQAARTRALEASRGQKSVYIG